MVIRISYKEFFARELSEFKNKSGIHPTHCIINSEAYSRLLDEIIIEHKITNLDEIQWLKTGNINYLGINIKRGNGTQLFYFYKE